MVMYEIIGGLMIALLLVLGLLWLVQHLSIKNAQGRAEINIDLKEEPCHPSPPSHEENQK